MVIWIIGLSGSGKTTLANKIVTDSNLRADIKKTVLIDGDIIREVFGNDIGYSMQDRLLNAQRICHLGSFLHNQGLNVVCAILSIFPETRKWNRENIEDYYEIFIDTPIDILVERDSKGIYEKFNSGKISNVVGMDIEFPPPDQSDLVIDNSSSLNDLLSHSDKIVKLLCS
tara:strand:+ start:186 stop:698 length:513 start_codon:yes stop_codon:yes gene_type:complete